MPASPPSKTHLGRAIRRLRLERGLTIEQLADRADMHSTYLSRIERARNSAIWEKLCALATALDLKISDLVVAAEKESSRSDPLP